MLQGWSLTPVKNRLIRKRPSWLSSWEELVRREREATQEREGLSELLRWATSVPRAVGLFPRVLRKRDIGEGVTEAQGVFGGRNTQPGRRGLR